MNNFSIEGVPHAQMNFLKRLFLWESKFIVNFLRQYWQRKCTNMSAKFMLIQCFTMVFYTQSNYFNIYTFVGNFDLSKQQIYIFYRTLMRVAPIIVLLRTSMNSILHSHLKLLLRRLINAFS